MTRGHSKILRAAIFEIIQNQIEADNPPETKRTLNRLLAEGYSKKEAMNLIGGVVVSEIVAVAQEGGVFDEAAFAKALLALPTSPWQ